MKNSLLFLDNLKEVCYRVYCIAVLKCNTFKTIFIIVSKSINLKKGDGHYDEQKLQIFHSGQGVRFCLLRYFA